MLLALVAISSYAQTNAILQLANGKLDKAKEEIDKAILDEKMVGKAKTWITRAQIYESIAMDQTGVFNKLDSMAAITAYDAYKKTIELDTKDGKEGKTAKEAKEALVAQKLYAGLMTQGAAKYQNKNFKDAFKLMSLAGEVMSKDTVAALYTGIVSQLLKDDANMFKYFDKFLALGGKDPAIYYSLATTLRSKNETDKAIAMLDRGIAANPENKDLRNEKINILLASGKADEAIGQLKGMVEKDPSNVQNTLNLAILYDNASSAMGDEIKKLKTAAAAGDMTEINNKLTAQKEKVGAFEDEIKRLTDKIKKEPKTAAASKKQIADVTSMRDEQKVVLEKMTGDVAKVAATAGGAAEAAKKLTEVQKKQADLKAMAQDYYGRALKLDPTNYDATFNMGVYFFNEGLDAKSKIDALDMKAYQKDGKLLEEAAVVKFKQAMSSFEKAWDIKKEADLKENLKNVYMLLKQLEKSEAYETKIANLEK